VSAEASRAVLAANSIVTKPSSLAHLAVSGRHITGDVRAQAAQNASGYDGASQDVADPHQDAEWEEGRPFCSAVPVYFLGTH